MPSPNNRGLGATRDVLPLDRADLPAVVRPLRRADLSAVVELRRRVWPDRIETPGSVAWALDHPDPGEHMRRWVVTIDRVVVGSAAASRATWTPNPVAYVYVGVDASWRGRGFGGRLFDLGAAHAMALGTSRILVATDRGDEASARFVAARGFHRTREIRTWSLDPAAAPLRDLLRLRAVAEAAGLQLVPVRALLGRPAELHRLHVALERDIPSDEPVESTFATWRLRQLDTPLFDPDASFLVLDGSEPVALTWMFVDREGRRAGHGLTGTLPAYRHRGLARLVKLASLDWLAEHGVGIVYTDNDSTNADILALNEHLGFRPLDGIELWARNEVPDGA